MHWARVKTKLAAAIFRCSAFAAHALSAHTNQQNAHRVKLGSAWADSGLVRTARTGRPVEPCAHQARTAGARSQPASRPGALGARKRAADAVDMPVDQGIRQSAGT